MKTCKNITEYNPVDEFICSECGIILIDFVQNIIDEHDNDVTYSEYCMKHCPECGKKVEVE